MQMSIENNGVSVLFEEFYARLFERSEAFRSFFSTDVRKRGAILLRIIEQLVYINLEMTKELEKRFLELGRMHRAMNIRPWMFSVFVETCVSKYLKKKFFFFWGDISIKIPNSCSHSHPHRPTKSSSFFIFRLLESIIYCLGASATFLVVTSWTKLFSWALHQLLPTAIHSLVLETEMSQNYNEEILNKIEVDSIFKKINKSTWQ